MLSVGKRLEIVDKNVTGIRNVGVQEQGTAVCRRVEKMHRNGDKQTIIFSRDVSLLTHVFS